MWHDHGTILGQGYIFITVKVIYDTSVFFRKDEYSLNSTLNLQGTIEKPEVHVIGIASSSHEDQAALIPERMSCLRTLNSPIMTTAGIPINGQGHINHCGVLTQGQQTVSRSDPIYVHLVFNTWEAQSS